MDDIVFKTVLLRGAQGAQGEPGTADAMPAGGVISFEGQDIPEGFEETTIDNVPTKNSNNVVESGGIYASENGIYKVMGEMGAKNLVPYPYYDTTKEVNGVTFTDNGDGTITLNGESTAETSFWLHGVNDMMSLLAGAYIIEQPIDYNEKRLFFRVYERSSGTNVRIVDYNTEGRTIDIFTLQQNMPNLISIALITRANQIYDNFIIKPMIRLASDTDDTYQPYAKTNKQLTDDVVQRTAKGTNLVGLVSAVNKLTEEQKSCCVIYVNDTYYLRRILANEYNVVYLYTTFLREMQLKTVSNNPHFYQISNTYGEATRNVSEVAVTSWTLYYKGIPIS